MIFLAEESSLTNDSSIDLKIKLAKISCPFNSNGQVISTDTINIRIFIEEIVVLMPVQNRNLCQNELGKSWIYLQLFRTIMANI